MVERDTKKSDAPDPKVRQVLKTTGLYWAAFEAGRLEGRLENILNKIKYEVKGVPEKVSYPPGSFTQQVETQLLPPLPPLESIPEPEIVKPWVKVEDIHNGIFSTQLFLLAERATPPIPNRLPIILSQSQSPSEEATPPSPRKRKRNQSFQPQTKRRHKGIRRTHIITDKQAEELPTPSTVNQQIIIEHEPSPRTEIPEEEISPSTYTEVLSRRRRFIKALTSEYAQDLYLGVGIGMLSKAAVYSELINSNMTGLEIALIAGGIGGLFTSSIMEYFKQNVPEGGTRQKWEYLRKAGQYNRKSLLSIPDKNRFINNVVTGAGLGTIGGLIGYVVIAPLLHDMGKWLGSQLNHINQNVPVATPPSTPLETPLAAATSTQVPEPTHTPAPPTPSQVVYPTHTPAPTHTPEPTVTPHPQTTPSPESSPQPLPATNPTPGHTVAPTPTPETTSTATTTLHLSHPENTLILHPGQTPSQVVDHYINSQTNIILTPSQEDKAVKIFLAANGGLDPHYVPADKALNTDALNQYLLQIKAQQTIQTAIDRLPYIPNKIYIPQGSSIGPELYERITLVTGHSLTQSQFDPLVRDTLIQNHINSDYYNVHISGWRSDTSLDPGTPILLGDKFYQELQNLILTNAR